MTQDLVCRREVDSNDARFFTDYNDGKYYFCSAECKRAFDDHPDRYIQDQARRETGMDL